MPGFVEPTAIRCCPGWPAETGLPGLPERRGAHLGRGQEDLRPGRRENPADRVLVFQRRRSPTAAGPDADQGGAGSAVPEPAGGDHRQLRAMASALQHRDHRSCLGWTDGKPPADPVGGSGQPRRPTATTAPPSNRCADADRGGRCCPTRSPTRCAPGRCLPTDGPVRYHPRLRPRAHLQRPPVPGLRGAGRGTSCSPWLHVTTCSSSPMPPDDVDFPNPEPVRRPGMLPGRRFAVVSATTSLSFEYLTTRPLRRRADRQSSSR